MEIARKTPHAGVPVDTSHISDIALEPSDTSFNITPCNPMVDDFNPYRFLRFRSVVSPIFSNYFTQLAIVDLKEFKEFKLYHHKLASWNFTVSKI